MAPTKRSTKHIHPQAREVIFNVINFFQSEKDCNGFLFTVHQVGKRAAAATGYSERSIARIRQQGRVAVATNTKISASKRRNRSAKFELDCSQLLAIKNIISNIYTDRKQAPTLNTILHTATEQLKVEFSREYLRRIIIKKLGYKYKRCQNKSFLIEKHDIRLQRAKYLHRLQQNTALGLNAKTVVYLDETWLQQLPTSSDNLKKKKPKKRLYIMMNGAGRMGFIPEAKLLSQTKLKTTESHSEMDAETFTIWLNTNLIPYLPNNAIVVLGNTPAHIVQMNKPPSSTSKREDLEKWLQQHKVPFDSNLLKVQLYELIKLNCPSKVCVIDEILKENGHEVLRLPPYNYDLNPIEYMCSLIKKRLAEIDSDISETEMETLTTDAIDSLKNTDWVRELAHVKRLEEEYWRKELQTEREIEQLIIAVCGNESDSETEYEFESGSTTDYEDPGPSSPSCMEPVVDIVEFNS